MSTNHDPNQSGPAHSADLDPEEFRLHRSRHQHSHHHSPRTPQHSPTPSTIPSISQGPTHLSSTEHPPRPTLPPLPHPLQPSPELPSPPQPSSPSQSHTGSNTNTPSLANPPSILPQPSASSTPLQTSLTASTPTMSPSASPTLSSMITPFLSTSITSSSITLSSMSLTATTTFTTFTTTPTFLTTATTSSISSIPPTTSPNSGNGSMMDKTGHISLAVVLGAILGVLALFGLIIAITYLYQERRRRRAYTGVAVSNGSDRGSFPEMGGAGPGTAFRHESFMALVKDAAKGFYAPTAQEDAAGVGSSAAGAVSLRRSVNSSGQGSRQSDGSSRSLQYLETGSRSPASPPFVQDDLPLRPDYYRGQ